MAFMANNRSPGDKLSQLTECLEKVAENQDRQAFEQLFDHYAPLIRAYSLAREPGADLVADELVQEVMTRVWLKADKYNSKTRHPGRFNGYSKVVPKKTLERS